jgi:AmmeMemoRadiSam system protein B
MDRTPAVAGQFYPGNARDLTREISEYTIQGTSHSTRPTILAMVPHAGYVYSGAIAGETIARANLAETIVLLGPNHTGNGDMAALWPDGRWLFPGGSLAIDEILATEILQTVPGITSDYTAHLREHSLEVQIPLLHAKQPTTRIVPICIADPRPQSLLNMGSALAEVIAKAPSSVSIVVSSDMSHFISADKARAQDRLAIDQILALSPKGLFQTVHDHAISMCGIFPMTMGLQAACILGATQASLIRYGTSGDINRDNDQVVGYAGIIIE